MANTVNLAFIEKYQTLYEKNPDSKIFAPLGEAYRKMGMLDEALRVLTKGVQLHPNFPSGRVALAKTLLDRGNNNDALDQLEAAVESSTENILAYKLLAQCYLRNMNTKKALKAYKKVLFLNPSDPVAQKHVQKLESLTADEYDEEVFALKDFDLEPSVSKKNEETIQKVNQVPENTLLKQRHIERMLSLTDAFIVRNEMEKASKTLAQAELQLGSHPEIVKRKRFVSSRLQSLDLQPELPQELEPENIIENDKNEKIHLLQELLERINIRRIDRNI